MARFPSGRRKRAGAGGRGGLLLLIVLPLLDPSGGPVRASPPVSGEPRITAETLEEQLPEKLVTIVDKTLDDQFSRIERLAAQLPDVERRDVFLITLPLENFIEDVLFPTNRPVAVYPRILFRVIAEELGAGRSKKTVATLLVRYQQENAFEKLFLDQEGAEP